MVQGCPLFDATIYKFSENEIIETQMLCPAAVGRGVTLLPAQRRNEMTVADTQSVRNLGCCGPPCLKHKDEQRLLLLDEARHRNLSLGLAYAAKQSGNVFRKSCVEFPC
jgi:hypothetical protein